MEFPVVVRHRHAERQESLRKDCTLLLQLQESFGCLQRFLPRNNYICGSTLVYLQGNLIVLHNIIQANKKFITRINQDETVAAFACSFERHAQIAIASTGKKQTSLSLYSENSDTVLTYCLPQDDRIVDIAFVGNAAVVALTSTAVLILRRDPTGAAAPGQFESIPMPKGYSRICEAYPSKVIVNNAEGIFQIGIREELRQCLLLAECPESLGCVYYENEICIVICADRIRSFKHGKMVEELLLSDLKTHSEAMRASCVCRYSRGFFIGHGERLAVSMFQLENGAIKYSATYGINEKIKGAVLSLNMGSDEMYIAVAGLVGETVPIPGEEIGSKSYLENMLVNLTNLSERGLSSIFTRPFRNQIEYGCIQAMKGAEVPHCFSLVGGSLVDYSYEDYFRRLASFNLNETLVDFAVHPFGFQLACLLKDSLRVFCKLEKDLVEVFTLPYAGSSAEYSPSGLLAIAMSNNLHQEVAVLETVKFQVIRTLDCFSYKHPVTRIGWNKESSLMYLFGGANEFCIVDPHLNFKCADFYQRKKQVGCIHFEERHSCLLVCFSDGLVKVYQFCSKDGSFDLGLEMQLGEAVAAVCFIMNAIVLGTAGGKILWSNWPISSVSVSEESFEQLHLSSEPVTHLHLAGLKYLVVGLGSGMVCAMRLKRRKDSLVIDIEQDGEYSKFKDIVVQSKPCLDQTKERLKNLLEKRSSYIGELEEMKKDEENRYALELRELVNQSKQEERKNLRDTIGKVEANKLSRAALEREANLLESKRLMTQKDWQLHADNQLLGVYREHEGLVSSLKVVRERLQGRYEELRGDLSSNVRHVQEQFCSRITAGRSMVQELRNRLARDRHEQVIMKAELQEQGKRVKQKEQQQMQRQEEELNRINNEEKARLSKLQRQIDRYDLRKDFLEGKRKYLQNQFHVQQSQLKSLQRVKNSLNLELVNLQEATNKREEMIREFSNRNDKLVRFKTVYSYLQRHLEEETDTLAKHISVLSDQIMKVNGELVSVLNQERHRNQILQEGVLAKRRLEELRSQQATPVARLNSFIKNVLCLVSNVSPGDADQREKATRILEMIRRQMGALEQLSSSSRLTSLKDNKFLESMQEYNLEQVRNNLTEQKKYLQQNIQRFWASQRLLQVDLVAVYVKLQAKNSHLITECNILKEKLNKKRKCLNEQLNNLKTGENLLLNIQRSYREVAKPNRPSTSCALSDWFTVIGKETRKNSHTPQLRVKTVHRADNSSNRDTKCDTLLYICQVNPAEASSKEHHFNQVANRMETQSKPSTSNGSRTALGKSRRKVAGKRIATGGAIRPPLHQTTPQDSVS